VDEHHRVAPLAFLTRLGLFHPGILKLHSLLSLTLIALKCRCFHLWIDLRSSDYHASESHQPSELAGDEIFDADAILLLKVKDAYPELLTFLLPEVFRLLVSFKFNELLLIELMQNHIEGDDDFRRKIYKLNI
jgi:hypothetical protein